jgi:hypothetical protein
MNNNEIRIVSDLPNDKWAQVRGTYYISSHPMDLGNAKRALFEFDDILKDLGVEYFLSCGTALGFYRDGNFIPWDDEIDVDILAETYVARFYEMRERFIDEGFIARSTWRGPGGLTSKMSFIKNGIKIATCGLSDDGNGFRCDRFQRYPAKCFETPEVAAFGGRNFNLPSPADEYLTFLYGDWRTPIKSYNPDEYLNKNKNWRR